VQLCCVTNSQVRYLLSPKVSAIPYPIPFVFPTRQFRQFIKGLLTLKSSRLLELTSISYELIEYVPFSLLTKLPWRLSFGCSFYEFPRD
jgi:hypothetical protein